MVYLLFNFIGGAFCGSIITIIFFIIKNRNNKFAGTIEVDDRNNLSKFHITTTKLSDTKTKIAIFDVRHGVDLSREEQTL